MYDRSMHRITPSALQEYLRCDAVMHLLDETMEVKDRDLTCQKWLLATPAKRYAAQVLYGDLFLTRGLRILDIGGGLSSLTRILAERHIYTLVDFMAHDQPEVVGKFLESCSLFRHVSDDWEISMPRDTFDVIIAADLFPNVDQRLGSFLNRSAECSHEIGMSLTWHSPPRQDFVLRGADEVMCVVGWDHHQIERVLDPIKERIVGYDSSVLRTVEDSVYPNGRNVCYLTIRSYHCNQ